MARTVETRATPPTGPAEKLVPVIPSDDADLPEGLTRALYVGGAGSLFVVDRHGTTVQIASGDAQYHPLRVRGVRAAGTTATGIVAIY